MEGEKRVECRWCINRELRKESTRVDGGQLRSNNLKYKGQSVHNFGQLSNPDPYNHD